MRVYSNYRWVPVNARKGDRYDYRRDVSWPETPWRTVESHVIAEVTYNSNPQSKYWGRWQVSFGAQSPGLYSLRTQEKPTFSSKQDAMAWATTMIALEGLS